MKTPIRMLLSLVAALTLCVAMTGCGGESNDTDDAADKMQDAANDAADKAGDMAEEAGDAIDDAMN